MVITKEFVKQLKDNNYRKKEGIFILQGDRFCHDAIGTDTQILYTITTDENLKGFPNICLVSEKVFSSLNSKVSGQHIFCVCKKKTVNLNNINKSLILDNIQDPGNMGTLIRSAAAFGFKDVFVLGGASPYSEKVVRSSASQILKINIHEIDLDYLKANKDKIAKNFLVADMFGESLSKIRLQNKNFAVIIGNEGNGVSEEVKSLADITVKIPMEPGVESLNAGVAGSIIMYELGE